MNAVACVLLPSLSSALRRLCPLVVCGASVGRVGWKEGAELTFFVVVVCGTAGQGTTEVHWMFRPGACDV